MLSVHVRVNDAATGRPTPVRLSLRDAAGNYLAPMGRPAEFATGPGEDVGGSVRLGPARHAYVDGACEARLPPGVIHVEIHKGPEYIPVRREVTLVPGQLALRFEIARWTDTRPDGWHAGDARAHELSPHAALLEGAAEGLAVVHVLATERPPLADRGGAFPNLVAFSGNQPALERHGCMVSVNTLNAHPTLGTVALLHCHRVAYPLRFGGAAGTDDWSVADWCDQCHRKTGLVVWPDLPRLTADAPQGEALAAALLGKVDAFEVAAFPEAEPDVLAAWYCLLDCGCRLPLVGASGKESNAVALGAVRTYARLLPAQGPGLRPWVEAVREGRTFITNGPLLTLAVNGEGPGKVLAGEVGRPLRIRAEASSVVAFDQLEVLAGGTVVATCPSSGDRLSGIVEVEVPVRGPTWVAARCWGRGPLPAGCGGPWVYAHSSPVYVEVVGQAPLPDPAAVAPLLDVLDRTLAWVVRSARCPTERHRQHLAEVLQAARQELLRRGRG
jgi:hypothetical protein